MNTLIKFWQSAGLFQKIAVVAGSLSLVSLFAPKVAGVAFWAVAIFGAIKWLFGDDDHQATEAGFRRGARLVSAVELKKMIEKSRLETSIFLGRIPIPIKIETLQILVAGAIGSGKSLVFDLIFKKARSRKNKAIIFDLNGVALSKYFKEGDIILNPFDSRSVSWSPFSEIQNDWDINSLTKSIVPDSDGSSAEWSSYAQSLLKSTLQSLIAEGRTTNRDLYQSLILLNNQELQELLIGTPASTMFEKGSTGILGSSKSIISTRLSPYQFLNPDAGKSAFSIKSWMKKENDSWLFINVRDDQLSELKPLVSAFFDIAIGALLSGQPIEPKSNKRTWFFLDEIASLGRIQSVEQLLTKGRKFGGVCVAGLQTTSQLNSSYGQYDSQTFLACFSNQVILRQNDNQTAKYFEANLGGQEIMRTVEGGSNGEKSTTSYSDQITNQQIVLSSELMNLKDRQGYLKVSGFPIAKIQIDIPTQAQKVAEEFIPN